MNILPDITLTQLLNRVVAFVLIGAAYSFALGLFARLLGGRTAELNPLSRLSFPGLLGGILYLWGWVLPPDVKASEVRWRRLGLVAILAGATVVLAVLLFVFGTLRPLAVAALPRNEGLLAAGLLAEMQRLGVGLGLFSLLPLPGLPGALWLRAIAPDIESRVPGTPLVWGVVTFVAVALGLGDLLLGGSAAGLTRLVGV